MSDRTFRLQDLARIEARIKEVEVRILELQERLRMLESAGLNTVATDSLLSILIEHMQLLEIRRSLILNDIHTSQLIGKTGYRWER